MIAMDIFDMVMRVIERRNALSQCNVEKTRALRQLDQSTIRNANLVEVIQGMKQNQPTLGSILEGIPRTAANWKQVDDATIAHFKVPIIRIPVDMPEYFEFFNEEIFPYIVNNRGDFQYEDTKLQYTCDINDFMDILEMNYTNMIPWLLDEFDCENHQRKLTSDLEYQYGITSYRTIYGKNRTPHAFGMMYLGRKRALTVEPQTDGTWKFGSSMVAIELKREGWYNFH